eukprot:gene26196-31633_t
MKAAVCIVYVSEALSNLILDQLKATICTNCIHSFSDSVYNRTSFYLAGPNLVEKACLLCETAYELIDFQKHTGTHPSLGVVDHVCFSPLGGLNNQDNPMPSVASLARSFGQAINDISGVPVYYYGHATADSRRLKDVRRSLGYFGTPTAASGININRAALVPDIGALPDPHKGIMCIGAVPLVVNCNMRFRPQDPRDMVLRVTQAVRSHDVEALTLRHQDGAYEVACNLLSTTTGGSSVESVVQRATEVAHGLGVQIDHIYTTAPSESELMRRIADIQLEETT